MTIYPGADPVGGSRTPPPFGGPPNFIKREKMLRACARISRVLVLNSYPDSPPPPFRNPVSAPESPSIEPLTMLVRGYCMQVMRTPPAVSTSGPWRALLLPDRDSQHTPPPYCRRPAKQRGCLHYGEAGLCDCQHQRQWMVKGKLGSQQNL